MNYALDFFSRLFLLRFVNIRYARFTHASSGIIVFRTIAKARKELNGEERA